MRYLALATDYDGTLARDGHIEDVAVEAIDRLRLSGRMTLLITGREVHELRSVCPHLKLFEIVVAENGGVLYWPREDREEVLSKPVPEAFLAEMNRLNVKPFSVGKVIFATWRPHEAAVQEAIQRLGIDFHIIFNKRAVMVLPNSVTKATGLMAAAERLRISPSQIVGVGDAENDFAFLRICGVSAAVANALPALKQGCDLTMSADHGDGVVQLISELIRDDLQSVLLAAKRRDSPTKE